jgi:hypothetical protein
LNTDFLLNRKVSLIFAFLEGARRAELCRGAATVLILFCLHCLARALGFWAKTLQTTT